MGPRQRGRSRGRALTPGTGAFASSRCASKAVADSLHPFPRGGFNTHICAYSHAPLVALPLPPSLSSPVVTVTVVTVVSVKSPQARTIPAHRSESDPARETVSRASLRGRTKGVLADSVQDHLFTRPAGSSGG